MQLNGNDLYVSNSQSSYLAFGSIFFFKHNRERFEKPGQCHHYYSTQIKAGGQKYSLFTSYLVKGDNY